MFYICTGIIFVQTDNHILPMCSHSRTCAKVLYYKAIRQYDFRTNKLFLLRYLSET